MIFTQQWIREWVDVNLEPSMLISQLTMAGLEVDAHGPVAADFSGVIVAEVRNVIQHPDADKLRVCDVFDGTEVLQVVCGAANVRAGLKVPYAKIGAQLPVHNPAADAPASFSIKKAKLRGIESFGMLCSAEELGMSDSSDGLLELPDDAPPGVCVREYLKTDDVFYEMDLTPNRGDCLSIRGLAREIAALNYLAYHEPAINAVSPTLTDVFPVTLQASAQCPRYLGRVIKGINPDVRTPLWMQEKLRRCGLRSIDPVVDVTNYVLLELGQPMHAFDLQQLQGGIVVRMAEVGEKITLLDGKQIDVQADTLLIADHRGPLALAGIMGGENSGVSNATRDIFLECAWFDPLAIAGRARRYGLHTDASHRYERGVDSDLQHDAMERATQLLLEIVGGAAGPVIEQAHNVPAKKSVTLEVGNIDRLLGLPMSKDQILNILSRLGLILESSSETEMRFSVPSYRFDISIEADLIEELARVYGYDHLPVTKPLVRMNLSPRPEGTITPERLRERLLTLGYQQVISYSFVEPSLLMRLQPDIEPVALQNPISADMAVMRTTLWAGLIQTLQHNVNRQQSRIRLFETGQIFLSTGEQVEQPDMLGGLVYGSRMPAEWSQTKDSADFFDVKGDLEILLSLSGEADSFTFQAQPHPALHSGQSARIFKSGRAVGWIGALSPTLQRILDLSEKVYLFEIELTAVLTSRIPAFKPLSKFPEVSRDLALLLDKNIPARSIRAELSELAGEFLTSLRIFDVYQGDAIGSDKKSMALGLTWQHPSRTLGDDDINSIIERCVKGLEVKFNAKLRN
ncbi:phenylalanine--tRNA ligase subunit beta [Gammaproteobacteria bacterium LSUCC0112]|nr:phenylalanine--tRNA ligase subunit beta [Gammaproteobacteria bacterium LSUCC0112]